MVGLLLTSALVYGEDLGKEDMEILKDLEFFSNLELMEDEISLEDLEEMDEEQISSTKEDV